MNLRSKGKTLGNVSHVPSSVSPLHPHSVTPSGRPLAGENEFAYGKLVDIAEPLFKLTYLLTFLTFSRLKFDNSAKASNNQIFIRRLHLQNTRPWDFSLLCLKINTNLAMFGKAKRAWQVLEHRDQLTPLSAKDF